VVGFCIGEQTAQRAKSYGIQVKIAAEATMDALIDLILEKA
jgi:uroporphyrinogen III methyltransferase/synthase